MSLLASVQDQLRHVDEVIAGLERSVVSHPRPSLAANIRALEKERRTLQAQFERAAIDEEIDVYRYRILTSDRATITGLTEAWREFQNLLATVYESLRKGGSRKKAKSKAPPVPQIQLGFGYSFPGSVGVALTLPNREGLFSNEAIVQATEAIFEFASSYRDQSGVAAMARRLGPEPVEAMYAWVNAHVSHRYGVGIEWRRTEVQSRQIVVQYEELSILREQLSKTTIDTSLDVTGDLVAVDMDANTFRIRQDTGEEIEGTFVDAISAEQAAQIPARYAAHIARQSKVIQVPEALVPDVFLLQSLTPL
jgi:hypothetical protein